MATNPIANLPPQPVFISGDPSYASRFNEWVTLSNQAMTAYRAEYESAMRDQGISVQWDTPVAASPGSPFAVPPTYNATLTKDGQSTTTTVSIGRAQTTDASSLAGFDQMFNLKYNVQLSSPQGQLPSQWFEPTPTRVEPWVYNPEPFSTPGPSTTIPVPTVTIQPTQTPTTPDAGTIVTPPPPAGPEKHTFWEWNWIYEQQTSRVGPPPEAVGVGDGNTIMTRAEWWAKVSAWYAAPVRPDIPTGSNTGEPGAPGAPGGGGGSGGGNGGEESGIGAPVPGAFDKDYTQAYILGAALLAVMFLAKR